MRQFCAPVGAVELPLDAKEFANLLLDWAQEICVAVTPMKLQKILYYCHADFLSFHGVALIADDFEAWQFGPVISSVFQEFKVYSGEPISGRARRFNPITASTEEAPPSILAEIEDDIKSIFNVYIRFSATNLSHMSHVENGPWCEALSRFERGLNPKKKIGNDLIRAHHQGFFKHYH